jgi:predicted nucleic acid-binding protein
MSEAISDTGPILHLFEIDKLFCLHIFEQLYIPPLVASELEYFGLHPNNLNIDTKISIPSVDQQYRENVLQTLTHPPIHPADAEVFIFGQDRGFPDLVLTDDMALRRYLEQHDLVVVGSVGLLVRSYHQGLISHTMLNNAIDDLFYKSTLHLSPAFRIYVRNLIDNLD